VDTNVQILTQKLDAGLEGLVKLLEEADVSVDAAAAAADDMPALAMTEQSQRPELLQALVAQGLIH
jgi:hypothetical protein